MCGDWLVGVCDGLFAKLVQTHQRPIWVVRAGIHIQHVLNGAHEGDALLRRQAHCSVRQGFNSYFGTLFTVCALIPSTISSFTR
jgi:hypothetical protein